MRSLLSWTCLFSTIAVVAISFAAIPASSLAADDDDSGSWLFDKSYYTNNPVTGQRVDRYKKHKIPYRDPNALWDSPHTWDPFYYGWGDSWNDPLYGWNYAPWFQSGMMFDSEALKYEGSPSDLYPFDGDPNAKE